MHLDSKLLMRLNRSIPRYTSYPTAPQFRPIEESVYKKHLAQIGSDPVSLYIHIPFCRSMCLFCACSVVLNRSPERQGAYVDSLLQEIELLGTKISAPISQLHLGGGTPTSLHAFEFEKLFASLHRHFSFEKNAEISIEIDPRTVYADGGEKLSFLKRLGFNRVSFGVQDLDPKVQEAVKRRQTEEMTQKTFEKARELGFHGINIDLIYGLPFQTADRFAKTVETISSWRPDRIAFFSYARVPWLKKHQNAIKEEFLPSTEEKFAIYLRAREGFLARGYTQIGMDHFALTQDSLAIGYKEGTLQRNFQGYSLHLAKHMIGLGITSIGFVGGAYFQNVKSLELYDSFLQNGSFPLERGLVLTEEDQRRHWVIQQLMCRFEVDKTVFETLFQIPFDRHFEGCSLTALKEENLLEETETKLLPTPLGRLFIRLIASAFDAYLTESSTYSKLV